MKLLKYWCDGEGDTLPKIESILPWSILQPAVYHREIIAPPTNTITMASFNPGEVKKFKLNGMLLQVEVSGFVSGQNAKVKLQLQNCSQTWILHWGCITNGNKKWVIPSYYPPGTTVYKKNALHTPFLKEGDDAYVVVIELRDPKIQAIEFVLKDTKNDKWLKMNGASFHINLHQQLEVEDDGAGNAKCLLNGISEVEKLLRHRIPCGSALFPKVSTSWQGLISNTSLQETYTEMVGKKSSTITFLSKEVPDWIRFPASVVLPFEVFDKVLSQDINKEMSKKFAYLCEQVDKGDVLKLKEIQETILQMKAPRKMSMEVRKKMKSSRIPWPRGHGDDTWNRVWQAIKKVWASKWNERAYMRNDGIGILIQEYIRPDYAFVTCTSHPDSSQIYTEIVKGSVETLVGASRGRAMSCITKKSDLKSPNVTCYASKSTGLYTKNKRSVIFRPDYISENTNGYIGNGIYDSVSMEEKEEVVLDYSRDAMVVDLPFQTLILSKIAEAAKIIEDLYGCAQEIEGVVQDGQLYVLQCKPSL